MWHRSLDHESISGDVRGACALDVFGDSASVRVDADGWIDYMHRARIDGEWKIVNVLRELRR